ncbi:serine/threonine-protein kinase PknG [Planotetraspora sp. A-T 1434]|uniref:serine/threonine-protein kinase n=1 Tax=Planotetraspora sp. A-T 1434 TaxID=2979219 RepID=UPI0021BE2CF1|nr:serine/threonine-protein kinase [Planotetraspora sp. A-T 1434]MCT9929857.1 serine/threonine-protein kinase PknG [Planotetraspora sp. A-T 1434]
MTPCARPNCPGAIDDTGFCDTCGRRALPEPISIDTPVTGSQPRSANSVLQAVDGLVSLPVTPGEDPSSRIITDPQSLSFARKCRKHDCGTTISTRYADQPALLKGFCPKCGTAFNFTPRLANGEVVGDQYEVVGPIAHGGLGWVYVAKDTHLDDNHVALKGLIEPNDPVAVNLGIAERRFLSSLDHPNIVRIYNFVTHDDTEAGDRRGYIVMEYLNGRSLREILHDARRTGDGREPLPLEHVLAYGYEILLALEYLHGRELLYCDMKPDNVIRTANRIKIVDMGGVRRFDDRDSPVVGTPRYQVSRDEIAGRGLSVQSDVFTVGKMLEELFRASDDWRPGGAGGPDAAGLAIESFTRLVKRATDTDWNRRFASAARMAEQVTGVLRELLALRKRREHAEPSTLFAPTATLLDGGLSTVPSLERWTVGRSRSAEALPDDHPWGGPTTAPGALVDQRPAAASVAVGLPVPYVDPADPAADLLATVSAPDPRGLLDRLSGVRPESAEVEFLRCRAHLELADLDGAEECAARAEAALGRKARFNWRTAWHRGLLALARDEVRQAHKQFDVVYAAIPGEIAPKLALGYCAERLDQPERAELYYQAVWRRDRSHANAAFGLARLRLRDGDRAGAVAVLDEVPRVSRHYDAARVAAVRICSEPMSDGLATWEQLTEARRRLPALVLDGGEPGGKARDRLTAAVLEQTLERIPPSDDGPALENELRRKLEESFMRLAKQADRAADKGALVDLANFVRPWSWV